MPPLRRRTSDLLSLALVSCLIAALAGAIFVVIRDPVGSFRVAVIAIGLGGGVGYVFDENLWGLVRLGPIFAVLGLGLYALHVLFGLSGIVVFWIGVAVGVLVLAILIRALIASGSADYPYDD